VLRVEPDGTETVVAGTGDCGSAGDGGPATEAQLAQPSGVALLTDGGFLIADTENNLIRRVSPDGTISIVAGREPPVALQCGASGEYVVPIYLVIRQPLRGRAKQPLLVSYETTYDVSVVFIIRRGSTILSRVRSKASSGLAKATLGVSLRPGTYALELRGSGTALGVGDEPIPFKKSDVAPLLVTR
jgi:hypothetical protein